MIPRPMIPSTIKETALHKVQVRQHGQLRECCVLLQACPGLMAHHALSTLNHKHKYPTTSLRKGHRVVTMVIACWEAITIFNQSPSLGFTYSQIPQPLILPSYQWHLQQSYRSSDRRGTRHIPNLQGAYGGGQHDNETQLYWIRFKN